MFVTLEDETGYTNVVVWNDLVERQRKELLGARLLGVEGYMQKEGGVDPPHRPAARRSQPPARAAHHCVTGFSLNGRE